MRIEKMKEDWRSKPGAFYITPDEMRTFLGKRLFIIQSVGRYSPRVIGTLVKVTEKRFTLKYDEVTYKGVLSLHTGRAIWVLDKKEEE